MPNTSISDPKIEVFLNNNPRCQAELENTAKREKWHLSNTTSVTIKGQNFIDGQHRLALKFENDILTEEILDIIAGNFEKVFELPAPLVSPCELEVMIGTDFHQRVPINLKRLYGKVTFFDGGPVANPIITAGHEGICAVGNAEGTFELYLHGPATQVAVWDKSYSISSVETWLYDVDLHEDTRLDVKIGKLELYEMGAWKATTGVYIHFIPMSMTLSSNLVRQGLTEKELITHPEIWPHLKKEDLKVFINNEQIPMSTFNEFDDFLGSENEEKYTRPGYIIGISRENWKPGIIKIEASYRAKVGEEEVIEKGEGYYMGLQ